MPRDRVLALIERMAKSRIVVVGDLILDRYLIGDTERLSPEAPVPVVTVREQRAALGGAANVAANVAAMGATCRLVGVVGDDATGRALRAEMATLRLTDTFVETTAGRPTTSKTRVLARGQQVVRIDEEVDRLLEGAELDKITAKAE
ncbi:MAG TPA: PfkB family carbohydrate kinase [Gemmatimonadales bacterium]|nr:PfkB family carbohydrate kinase [Gemmatimonadales bacterium]